MLNLKVLEVGTNREVFRGEAQSIEEAERLSGLPKGQAAVYIVPPEKPPESKELIAARKAFNSLTSEDKEKLRKEIENFHTNP